MNKTNAIRLLEINNIDFEIKEYEFDESDLSAVNAANKLGVKPETVFKTLVARGDKTGICIFCIPSDFELDFKKAAKASGNKNIEMVKIKDLFNLTGYIRGGCSPVGMKKKFPIFIDDTAILSDRIYVSAGQRGLQMYLKPNDLRKVTEAVFCDIT